MENLTYDSILELAKKTKVLRVRTSWTLANEAYIMRCGKTEVLLIPNGWLDRAPAFRNLLMGDPEWLLFLNNWTAQYKGVRFPPSMEDPDEATRRAD